MKTANSYYLVLDIETSTLFNQDKEALAVWLAYGYINLYQVNGTRVETNYFREWDELSFILSDYSKQFCRYNIFCFVHNLSYEFDFLIKNISKAEKILSNSTHNVISCVLSNFKNIEFHCTYQLSGYSLREIGKQLNFPKLESEYRLIYPYDEVTEEEKEYCIRDCDIVAKYISNAVLKEYKFLSNIPYTKTGRVRKKLKEFYYADKTPKDWDLMPPENCYKALNDAFGGGYCIVNPIFFGKEIKNVRCFDETSAYPFAALSELYPYSIYKEENPSKFDTSLPFWIAKIKFNNIRSKYSWGCLSISKMNDFALTSEYFNGKLISSEYITRTITNIDFKIINLVYDYDNYEIIEFYNCDKYSPLPTPIIETIEHYAIKKGELKEKIKGSTNLSELQELELERDYMLAKNDFNSIYGMMVQKLIQEEFYIDENFEWKVKEKEYKYIEGKHLRRNFLYGIYITAYARYNLILAIITNCPITFIYADTDSIKYIDTTGKFIDTNKVLTEYKNNKYIKNLGRFDEEKGYKIFKTFGAKKYCYTYDTEIHLTVAGVPKNSVKLSSFSEFHCGKVFKDCKLGTKYFYKSMSYTIENNVAYFEEDAEYITFMKEHEIESNGGVVLYPTSYVLDISKDDRQYITEIYKTGGLQFWVEKIKQLNGIDLTEYCDMEQIPI